MIKGSFRNSLTTTFKTLSETKLLKNVLESKLPAFVLLGILNLALLILILQRTGFWDIGQMKDILLWFVFSGIATIFRGVSSQEPAVAIKQSTLDNFKLLIFVEFFLSTYTLSLVGELIMLPLISIVVITATYASTKPEYADIAKPLLVVQGLLGLTLIVWAIWGFWQNPNEILSTTAVRLLVLPPLLAVAFAPLSYAIALVSAYEQLFLPLKTGRKKPLEVKRYAKRKLLRHCHLNIDRIIKARLLVGQKLKWTTTKKELDSLLIMLQGQ